MAPTNILAHEKVTSNRNGHAYLLLFIRNSGEFHLVVLVDLNLNLVFSHDDKWNEVCGSGVEL